MAVVPPTPEPVGGQAAAAVSAWAGLVQGARPVPVAGGGELAACASADMLAAAS